MYMSGNSFGKGACCLPAVDGLTYLKIGARQITIGIQGLDTVFQQLYAMGRTPEEASDEELIAMARRHNYIRNNPEVEADYAAAFRRAYAVYYARKERSRRQIEQE
jgi:hypothetical protein